MLYNKILFIIIKIIYLYYIVIYASISFAQKELYSDLHLRESNPVPGYPDTIFFH